MLTQISIWLAMGGYGQYVWSSYGLGLAIVLFNWFYAKHKHAKLHAKVREQHV